MGGGRAMKKKLVLVLAVFLIVCMYSSNIAIAADENGPWLKSSVYQYY